MSVPGATELLAGRYRLEQQAAPGGFGEVWRAADTVLQRPVAVKLLRARICADPQGPARFRGRSQPNGQPRPDRQPQSDRRSALHQQPISHAIGRPDGRCPGTVTPIATPAPVRDEYPRSGARTSVAEALPNRPVAERKAQLRAAARSTAG